MTKAVKLAIAAVALALAIAAGSGCAQFRDRIQVDVLPEDELYQLGLDKYQQEQWEDAIAVFDRFERLYVSSSRVQEVRLLRADAYFNRGRMSGYILAKSEYQSFIALYPRYERPDYVWKQIALCSFHQILPPNRDQSHTEAAIEDFQTFLQRYPDSDYAQEIRSHMQEAYGVLAEHHYIVGRHYSRRGLQSAAAERFTAALELQVEINDREGLYFRLVESLARASDLAARIYPLLVTADNEDLAARYRQQHENYLYDARRYLAEFIELFPQATGRHQTLQRLVDGVTPLREADEQ